jgi:hypothetical protein
MSANSGDGGKETPAQTTPAQGQGSEPEKTQATAQPATPLATAEGKGDIPAWTKQLKADLQGNASLTKFRDISEIGKAYLELEGKLGSAIIPPAKDAPQEAWDAFHQKMGRPKTPQDYSLEAPKDLPKGMNYTTESTKEFRELVFSLGLSQDQASKLHSSMLQASIQATAAQTAARASEAKACEAALREEYGDKYPKRIENIRRAVTTFGDKEIIKKISERGLDCDVGFMKFLSAVGEELREDSLVGANAAGSSTEKGFAFPGI